jgi:membrane associated rhomboid family serine protease
MGLENRDYVREDYDDGPQWSDTPLRRRSGPRSMIVTLILITAAVFVLQLITVKSGTGSSAVQSWLELTGEDVWSRGQVWRFLSYAFVHSQKDPLHLVFNMLMLYSIGTITRDKLGDREFLWYYLAAGVFAGICSLVSYSLLKMPVSIIGASGAVLAVFCIAALHYPRQQSCSWASSPSSFAGCWPFSWALTSFPS